MAYKTEMIECRDTLYARERIPSKNRETREYEINNFVLLFLYIQMRKRHRNYLKIFIRKDIKVVTRAMATIAIHHVIVIVGTS